MSRMYEVENPRVPHWSEQDICGHTEVDIGGREWICVLDPHPAKYSKRKGGGLWQHYLVNRWPYRNKESDD